MSKIKNTQYHHVNCILHLRYLHANVAIFKTSLISVLTFIKLTSYRFQSLFFLNKTFQRSLLVIMFSTIVLC